MIKYCPGCKKSKHLQDFNKDSHTKSGYRAYCKICTRKRSKAYYRKNLDSQREKNRKHYIEQYAENPEKFKLRIKRSNVKRNYGISLEEYESILKNGCAICNSKEQLVLDHCHKSGKIRDALCSKCNVMLGMANDNIEILRKGIEYVKRHN